LQLRLRAVLREGAGQFTGQELPDQLRLGAEAVTQNIECSRELAAKT
jgi:hypothetical protein